ncbi:MAG: TrkA C-terminal domain-containing protein [Candidatus Dormibacteria bacterium]
MGAATRPPVPGAPPQSAAPRLGDFRIVDVTLPDSQTGGHRVRDVAWPESSLVLAIRRGQEIVVPRGDTELRGGDRLTVLLPQGAALDLADVVSRGIASPAAASPAGHPDPPSG